VSRERERATLRGGKEKGAAYKSDGLFYEMSDENKTNKESSDSSRT